MDNIGSTSTAPGLATSQCGDSLTSPWQLRGRVALQQRPCSCEQRRGSRKGAKSLTLVDDQPDQTAVELPKRPQDSTRRQGSIRRITLCTAGVEGSSPFVSTTLATDTSKVALTRRSQSAGRVWTWQPLGTRYPRIVGVVAVTAC